MDRYEAFSDALAFVNERCNVTKATTHDPDDNIVVVGTDGEYSIKVTVEIKKEENEND